MSIPRFSRRAAFTLVEMMVSTTILALVMVMLLSTVDQTQKIWTRSTAKVSQFQAARSAFESMTRNLSQATLNTYYDVERSTAKESLGEPISYSRASELHFVSGKASQGKLLNGSAAIYPTIAVFFQSTLGVSAEKETTSNAKKYRALSNSLSAIGYYIEWGVDTDAPAFLQNMQSGQTPIIPERYRFRLKEIIQPTEALSIYATPTYATAFKDAKTTDWIQVALGKKAPADGSAESPAAWVRAENIVALVLLPKLPERERGVVPGGTTGNPKVLDLAPDYEYDTRPINADNKPSGPGTLLTIRQVHDGAAHVRKQFHQLPPIIQVTMVAIDEASAAKQQALSGEVPPDWTSDLFDSVDNEDEYFADLGEPVNPKPNTLIHRIAPPNGGLRMNYRIYSADVPLRAAKWSTVD